VGRPIVLSNGQLFVGLDENGLVHDFYYPYVGLENLTNARSLPHKIGVWVDGKFSWTDDGSWSVNIKLEEDALVGSLELYSSTLGISISTKDFVDSEFNAFIRQIVITNLSEVEKEVRLFTHQVFELSQSGRADTALYVPDDQYILDYKGRYCLLIGGRTHDHEDFDQYAVGNYQVEGKAGTYADAEDGELSNNPVEHGGVDSVLRFSKRISPMQNLNVDYWVIAANSQSDAQDIHINFKNQNMTDRLQLTRDYWQDWFKLGQISIPDFHPSSIKHSLLIIKAHCDERGSILASGDSSIFNYGRDYYCYCWPRDAAYALWPLLRLGHFDEAKKFLEFARDTKHKDGYLMHKYQPDRAIGSTWHPLVHGRSRELAIQEDETASVVILAGKYYEASHDKEFIEELYQSLIVPCADFMCRFIDDITGLPHASYDLWEEKFLTSTYTVSIVIAALEIASKLAAELNDTFKQNSWSSMAHQIRQNIGTLYHPDGYFRKGFLLESNRQLTFDDTIDISNLYGPYMYAGLDADDHRVAQTAKEIESKLLNTSLIGGVIRYENDNYFRSKPQYPGNPWIVSSLWLGQYYASIGKKTEANKLLDWSVDRELSTGALSEQYDPESGQPLGVTPLVWSHAEMINSLLDLSIGPRVVIAPASNDQLN
jgi:GH15 family glucan-1,4-alpha-glucosidase